MNFERLIEAINNLRDAITTGDPIPLEHSIEKKTIEGLALWIGIGVVGGVFLAHLLLRLILGKK